MPDSADRLYEQVLVVRCQAGDEAAFAELAERYSPRLLYYLRKMLGGSHAAEDALQDVWFDVFRGVARMTDPAAFPAWVYRVARDRANRELRKARRLPRPLCDDVLIDDAENGEAFTVEDAQQIHDALNRLAPEHREVLVLRFLEEMSYEEIAQVIGCPVGTVRSRIHYAKYALRRALNKDPRR